jgi:hypothetical protein
VVSCLLLPCVLCVSTQTNIQCTVKYKDFKTDLAEGVGEVAGVLFRVCKYAYERVSLGRGCWGGRLLLVHLRRIKGRDRAFGPEPKHEGRHAKAVCNTALLDGEGS